MKRPELFPGMPITEGGLIPTDRSLPPVPLKHTHVRAQIVGPLCAVEVEQQFHNTHTRPIEALYVFPLPENAAVSDLSLTLGDRTITGVIQEREEARREYEEAARQGQGAALLEQARPNLFSIAVANIQPDEHVQVTLRFSDQLDYDDGGYSFVLPTVATPRYTPKDQQEQAPPDSPLLPSSSREGHTLAVRVEIDAGKLEAVSSPSHPIDVTEQRGGRAVVTIKQNETLPNKDFVLRYRVTSNTPSATAFTYRPEGQPGTVLLTLTPQGVVESNEIVPRELLFVIDRSGSMSGTAMVQARNALRACLRALNEGDLFNIFPFDNIVEEFAPKSQPFTQESIDRADTYIAGIEARGGTEILGALKHALSHHVDPERMRVVVFLTDGSVGNEDEVLRELSRNLGEARVFAFGIGSAVNRFLLNKLAEVGRGSAEYLLPGEEIEEAIQRFQRRTSYPLITDVTIDWGGARVTDLLPAPLPDLYAGQPLVALARFHNAGNSTVRVRGRTRRGAFEQSFEVEWPSATPDRSPLWMALPQVWARTRIDHLMSESRQASSKTSPNRDEILSLGLTYRLMTPYTSFVAIEERRAEHKDRDKAERVHVPIHLPEGTLREAFEPPQPVYASMVMHRMAAPASPSALGAPRGGANTRKATGFLGGVGAVLREGFDALSGKSNAPAAPPAAEAYAASAPMPAPVEAQPATVTTGDAAAALRFLARTQSVNGSWSDDVTATALALAAFVHGGHTDRSGGFRPQLTRAIAWLSAQATQPAAPVVIAWALAVLAETTGAATHQQARDIALAVQSPTDALDNAFIALAQRIGGHQTASIDLGALPNDSVTTTSGILSALIRSEQDTGKASETAKELARLQSQHGSDSGAVRLQGASPATSAAATALGALVW